MSNRWTSQDEPHILDASIVSKAPGPKAYDSRHLSSKRAESATERIQPLMAIFPLTGDRTGFLRFSGAFMGLKSPTVGLFSQADDPTQEAKEILTSIETAHAIEPKERHRDTPGLHSCLDTLQ